MNDDCLFCSIASGDMDAYRVYETEDAVAFLDINPVSRGHTLVIPKEHATTLPELGTDATAAVFETVHTVMSRIEERLNPAGINLLQNNGAAAGQEVGHVHVHIIPRYETDGFDFTFDQGSLDKTGADELLRTLTQ